jgi:transposase
MVNAVRCGFRPIIGGSSFCFCAARSADRARRFCLSLPAIGNRFGGEIDGGREGHRREHVPLKDTGLKFERIGLEAGQRSSWLHKGLTLAGLPAICVESPACERRDAGATGQERPQRHAGAGANNAHGLVQGGTHQGEDSQKLRALMSSRRCLLDKQHDLDNHIRGALRTFGLKAGVIGQSGFGERARELVAQDRDTGRATVHDESDPGRWPIPSDKARLCPSNC